MNTDEHTKRSLLPVIIGTIGVLVMVSLSVYHLQFQNTFRTSAANTKPTKLYGVVERLPSCVNSFLCYSLRSVDGNVYLLSSKKYTDGIATNKQPSGSDTFTLFTFDDFVGKNVKAEGFKVTQEPPYLILTTISNL